MTDREALLSAVIATPKDDLPRLVFADWLEENGEAERAEFIRVQCQISEGKEGRVITTQKEHSRINGLYARSAQLRYLPNGNTRTDWTSGIDVTGAGHWKRGFIHNLTAPLSWLIEHGPVICREHPVESVGVTDKRPDESREGDAWWYPEDDEFPECSIPDGLRLKRHSPSTDAAIASLNAAVLSFIQDRSETLRRSPPPRTT